MKNKNYKLHKFDKFPFGKYKNDSRDIRLIILDDLDYVLWFQKLENIEYSKCILDAILKQEINLQRQKDERNALNSDYRNERRKNKKTYSSNNFAEDSGLEEFFRISTF